jgi:RNA polymerase sigma factor (sigma-70 family)
MAGRNHRRTQGIVGHIGGFHLPNGTRATPPTQAAPSISGGQLCANQFGGLDGYHIISRYNRLPEKRSAGKTVSVSAWDEIQRLVERVLEAECAGEARGESETERDRLIDLLRPQVHSMMRALTRDQNLVDDLVQETLLHLWCRLPQYNPKIAPFKHWAGRVVINYAYNMLERHTRITCHELRESEWLDPNADEETPSVFEWAASSDPDPYRPNRRAGTAGDDSCLRPRRAERGRVLGLARAGGERLFVSPDCRAAGSQRKLGAPDHAPRTAKGCRRHHLAPYHRERRRNSRCHRTMHAIYRTAHTNRACAPARNFAGGRRSKTSRLATTEPVSAKRALKSLRTCWGAFS